MSCLPISEELELSNVPIVDINEAHLVQRGRRRLSIHNACRSIAVAGVGAVIDLLQAESPTQA